jgi:hypothetical protein
VLFEKSTMLLRHRRIGGEKDGRGKKDKKGRKAAHWGASYYGRGARSFTAIL